MIRLKAIVIALVLFCGLSSFTLYLGTYDNCFEFAIASADNFTAWDISDPAWLDEFSASYDFCNETGGCPCEVLNPVIIGG